MPHLRVQRVWLRSERLEAAVRCRVTRAKAFVTLFLVAISSHGLELRKQPRNDLEADLDTLGGRILTPGGGVRSGAERVGEDSSQPTESRMKPIKLALLSAVTGVMALLP